MTLKRSCYRVPEDVLGGQIAVDQRRRAGRRQVNIIDFSDRSIGDPALDFAGLLANGQQFAQRVVDRYRGPKDEGRLWRAQLYLRRMALETMAYALQGYPCTFEEGYAEFRAQFRV